MSTKPAGGPAPGTGKPQETHRCERRRGSKIGPPCRAGRDGGPERLEAKRHQRKPVAGPARLIKLTQTVADGQVRGLKTRRRRNPAPQPARRFLFGPAPPYRVLQGLDETVVEQA